MSPPRTPGFRVSRYVTNTPARSRIPAQVWNGILFCEVPSRGMECPSLEPPGALGGSVPQMAEGGKRPQPGDVILSSAHPNPFNPSTVLSYKLQVASVVNLAVYDVSGHRVSELVNGWRGAGMHEVTFDATGLASGVYIYQLTAGEFNAIGKMILMK